MTVIEPYSKELRDLKQQAILDMDKPLLADLKEMEGEQFIYCETFFDALKASTLEEQLPTVESSELKEVFNSISKGAN
jgi:hypothetical protein